MKREENPGGNQLITLLIVGGVGYVAYQYLVSSGMWAQWFGGSAGASALPTYQQIVAGVQAGQMVGAGTDAAGNSIVHNIASGAYYAVNPSSGAVSAANGPGQLAVGAPTTVVTQPASTPPAQTTVGLPAGSSQLAAQLQAAGIQFMQGSGAQGLNIDQWMFYYQQIKGITLNGTQAASLIQAAGLSDATRGTVIPLSTFMNALGGVGLSGIVPVPNQGPIRAPIPTTQSFRGGYGGYGNSGRGKYSVN